MKNRTLDRTFKTGYDITYSNSEGLCPISFKPWSAAQITAEHAPQDPLKYFNDVLVSMNFHVLSNFEYCSTADREFIQNYLMEMDPYHQLFLSSQSRLKNYIPQTEQHPCVKQFETDFNLFLNQCFTSEGFHFKFLNQGLNLITTLEASLEKNLIYNYKTTFSPETNNKLLCFYSLLFHIRTLFALDYNFKTEDSAFESVKCDSITDYLPKSDFTANDALIYWQFKKLSIPFTGSHDIKVEKLLVHPMEMAFKQYNHNACVLIENLPEAFLTNTNVLKLEDKLYQIQMDWLLGSSCGLLFRIREELFGVVEGYNQIFWPDMNLNPSKKTQCLKMCFELNEAHFYSKKVG